MKIVRFACIPSVDESEMREIYICEIRVLKFVYGLPTVKATYSWETQKWVFGLLRKKGVKEERRKVPRKRILQTTRFWSTLTNVRKY